MRIEDEFTEIDTNGDWGRLFQQIKTESSNYEYTYRDAKKTENKNLNRYRDVSPYDHSRVKLVGGNCDYINASLVKVPQALRTYILAQGPLPHTAGHFWLMVWEQNSQAVLMLNKVIEKNTVKCHQYWPLGRSNEGDDEMVFNDVRLKVKYIREDEYSFYTCRVLKITHLDTQQTRNILHFHYTTWPDFGTPDSAGSFLIFLLAVRNSGVLNEDVGPPVVHCSAGIGRSGTFCLVDSCLVLIEITGDPDSINIKDILMDMRTYRMGLIQTPEQLRFSYLAIIEGAKRILSGTFTINALVNDEMSRSSTVIQNHSGSSHEMIVRSQSRERAAGERSSSEKREKNVTDVPPPLPPRQSKGTLPVGGDLNNCVQNHTSNIADKILSETDLRKRARQERVMKTAERIEQMKQRQQESETWRKRRLLLKPLSLGLLIILGGSLLVVYKFYYKG